MADCSYTIVREMNGKKQKIHLTRDEIFAISIYYDDVILEERIVAILVSDYGVTDVAKFKDIIDNIIHRYNKNIGYGCDEDYSMEFAFEEFVEEIEKLLSDTNKTEG